MSLRYYTLFFSPSIASHPKRLRTNYKFLDILALVERSKAYIMTLLTSLALWVSASPPARLYSTGYAATPPPPHLATEGVFRVPPWANIHDINNRSTAKQAT